MAFSLKDFFSNIKSANEPSAIGIDIGSSSIKVVQLKRKEGRAILETYGEIVLGPYAGTEAGRATNLQSEKLQEAISDLVREANVTTKNAALSIPFSSSLISIVQMPDLGEKKLAEMIPIEARRYIPVPISEVSLDWWVVPKSKYDLKSPEDVELSDNSQHTIGSRIGENKQQNVDKVDVLLVAILNEAISKSQSIVRGLDLQNVFFEIEVFSTMRSAVDQGIEPVMILDMGAGNTKLYIVEHGIIRDTHIINRGSQDITLALSKALNVSVDRAEEIKRTVGMSTDPQDRAINETITLSLDFMFSEANQVLLSFERKYNRTISKVVLAGGGSTMRGFIEAAKIHFQSEAILADPFSKVVSPAFLEPILKEVGPEFAVAVGVALRKLSQQ
jgi:type IV pilus assembly protein PilM